MDGPFLYISPRFFLKLFRVFEAYGWPLFVFFTHNSWKNWVQTLETPKVEKFVKKRGISRSSDTRDSNSLGICEKTGFHRIQTLEIPKVKDFVEQRGISRNSESPDSKNPWLQTLEIPKVKDFHVFEAYGWPLLSLKLMDAPFALWGYP